MFGWEKLWAFGTDGVKTDDGTLLLFNQIEHVERAVWPSKPGQPQRQMHLDFQVENVKATVEKALALGATIAVCPDPAMTDFVTMQDNMGHPFCLCNAANQPN